MGTVAFGILNGRDQARAGGWGPMFMDGGSAHDIGMRALGAVSKSHDGRGAPTILSAFLQKYLQLKGPEDLLCWAYANQGRWERLALLAPIVVDCAFRGVKQWLPFPGCRAGGWASPRWCDCCGWRQTAVRSCLAVPSP